MNMTPALSPSVPPMARRFFRYVDLFDVSLSEADAAGKGIGVARGQDGLGESPEWTFDRRRAIVILSLRSRDAFPTTLMGAAPAQWARRGGCRLEAVKKGSASLS